MHCIDFKNNLIDFYESNLSIEKKNEMERHIQTCTACNEILMNVKVLFLQLETEKNTKAEPYFINRVFAKIDHEKERKKQAPSLLFALPIRLITIVLSAGIIAGVMLNVFLLPTDVVTQVNSDKLKNELVSDNDNSVLTLNDE